MSRTMSIGRAGLLGLVLILGGVPRAAAGQARPTVDCSKLKEPADHASMDHEAHQVLLKACAGAPSAVPVETGQAAFAAIAEIVRILDQDPATDWSKVDVNALREHLRDMDDVMTRADMRQASVPSGFRVDATGQGRTIGAIRRMLSNHASMMNSAGDFMASVANIPGGARMVITARDPSRPDLVARLRGLGLAGVLTEGAHHQPHHLAIARGDATVHRH